MSIKFIAHPGIIFVVHTDTDTVLGSVREEIYFGTDIAIVARFGQLMVRRGTYTEALDLLLRYIRSSMI
jgi:hypothetical protein